MEKGPKQQYVEVWAVPFNNDDPISDQLEKKGKILVAL